MAVPKKTSWGGVSDWYDALLEEGSDTYQEKVLLPNLVRLTAPFHGKELLDLACGQGYFSRAFRAAGIMVSAADISPELIALARNRSSDISYHVASADDIPMIGDRSVDAVTIVLAIQNIEAVPKVFRECARVLRLGGKIFLVLNHPSFRIPKRSSWDFDEKKGIQYRRVDGYMSESREHIDMAPGARTGASTMSFHRPLQYYAKHLHNTGFLISRIEEWTSHKKSEAGPRAKAEDQARKEFPLFLMVEALRV